MTDTLFQRAWDELWAACEVRQKSEYKWKGSAGHYLTASDLAGKARELATGKTWYSGRAGGKWLNAARNWLSSQVYAGKLTSHNFGRRHCSGARFRPAGVAVTETERATMEAAHKPRPVHVLGTDGKWKALCMQDRKPRRSALHRSSRSNTIVTEDRSRVTCPRCKKLLAEQATAEDGVRSPGA